MKAVGGHIIIDKIKSQNSVVGGLELTESQNKDVRYLRAKVISIGCDIKGVDVGDIVMYDKHAGSGIEVDGKLYQVILLQNIVLIE